jgi:hypothetical protein
MIRQRLRRLQQSVHRSRPAERRTNSGNNSKQGERCSQISTINPSASARIELLRFDQELLAGHFEQRIQRFLVFVDDNNFGFAGIAIVRESDANAAHCSNAETAQKQGLVPSGSAIDEQGGGNGPTTISGESTNRLRALPAQRDEQQPMLTKKQNALSDSDESPLGQPLVMT